MHPPIVSPQLNIEILILRDGNQGLTQAYLTAAYLVKIGIA